MATLEKIRTKLGLLVSILIGFSLLLFVVSDLMSSGGSMFQSKKKQIGRVGKEPVQYTDFINKVDKLIEINKYQNQNASVAENEYIQFRDLAWRNMTLDLLFDKELKNLGLNVTGEELMDLLQGDNPHPEIRRAFTDPATGVFNRAAFLDYVQKVLEEDESINKDMWLNVEQDIYRQRKLTKYATLVRKGLYVTSLQATEFQKESGRMADFDYVLKPFSSISDSAISYNDKDLKAYYDKNIKRYKQDESRSIVYVTFDVVPSENDRISAEKWINEIKPDFEKEPETALFVNDESDVPYDTKNYKNGELDTIINNFMFNSEIGAVFGPYQKEGGYYLSKLAEINYLPDSAFVRHIQLSLEKIDRSQIFAFADSLKKLLENNKESFETLAAVNSADDNTKYTGGVIGWIGEKNLAEDNTTRPYIYETFVDSCILGQTGDIKIIPSQAGLHIVQITNQSKKNKTLQVGTLAKLVKASDETKQVYYTRAMEFGGKNNTFQKFDQAVKKQKDLNVYHAKDLKPDENGKSVEQIENLENSRSLIQWAFNAKLYDVTEDIFLFGDRYVVASLEKIKKEGYTAFEDIKELVEVEVIKEKKAEKITEEIKSPGSKSVADLSGKLKTELKSVSSIQFNSYSLPEVGYEPSVIGTAVALEKGEMSGPVVGLNGVYVIQITNLKPGDVNSLYLASSKSYLQQTSYMKSNPYTIIETIEDIVGVKDNRINFY